MYALESAVQPNSAVAFGVGRASPIPTARFRVRLHLLKHPEFNVNALSSHAHRTDLSGRAPVARICFWFFTRARRILKSKPRMSIS